ncbi:type VI secretion system-associated protein TagF [Marinomonas sp. A3A]|jgi:type VI secretion system protein ImpM|uniref:type VI secretion system-associated protein TagF n=1 Tax=Marinomonas sp. A3A TaxID=2065312 RepID=UPI001BB3ACA6|nr:type VI secretion system-associated protein TagF [Marinomonas sp. A3A]QUX92123.1 type VI secretion system-associated protein TagF [Marinomonas sp. A3A]
MSERVVSFGYLGKLPSMGDFLQDNVDADFQEIWDRWLQAVLSVSKERMGDSWKDKFLTGPVWHFAISSGVAGGDSKMGTVLPSMDAVGRPYPFTLVANTDILPVEVLESDVLSLEYEDAVLAVLEDSVDLFSWRKVVEEVVKPLDGVSKHYKYFSSPDDNKTAQVFEFAGTELGQGVVQNVLHALLYKKYGGYSVWWTHGSCLLKPSVIVTSGLPSVNQAAAMFDGRWQHWQWNHIQVKDNDKS